MSAYADYLPSFRAAMKCRDVDTAMHDLFKQLCTEIDRQSGEISSLKFRNDRLLEERSTGGDA